MVELGGRVRFRHAGKGSVKATTITEITAENISRDVEWIMTDESAIYTFGLSQEHLAKHSRINHSRKYVNGDIYTNTIESAFALLKRGLIGSFHRVSIKHLHRYLSEFEYRFNERNTNALFENTVASIAHTPTMAYRELIAEVGTQE